MRNATARQMINATAAAKAPGAWKVLAKWNGSDALKVHAANVTNRQARAHARAIREACGYALIERI